MIRIENVSLGMKVLSRKGIGTLKDLWLSDANRCYAVVELDEGQTIDIPLDQLSTIN